MKRRERAYECENPDCKCHRTDWSVRHCPVCGKLYLWDMNHPEKPCAECEDKEKNGKDIL